MASPAAAASVVNWLDIGIVVLLLASAAFAYARGLVHEVLSIFAWVGAVFAAIYGFPYLKPFARSLTDIDIVADLGAGIVLFVVALAVLSVIGRTIASRVKKSALNAVDRSLGFLFGLVRGALVVCVAYIGYNLIYPEKEHPKWIGEARAMALVKPGAAFLKSLIPENFSLTAEDDKQKGKAAKPGNPPGKRRVVQDLLTPAPKGEQKGDNSGDKQKDVVGYGDKERKEMDRLHESVKER
jgi:membrane protein required for colicin V production